MSNQVSMNGAGPRGVRGAEALQTVRLPKLKRETMIDSSSAKSRRRLSRALWRSASSNYGGRMHSRRGSKEETEDTHEMEYQNMASLGRFSGVLW